MNFHWSMKKHEIAKTQIIQSRDTYIQKVLDEKPCYRVGISIRSWTCHRKSNRKRQGVFIFYFLFFLGPYNKTLNFHWSIKKHEIERKVLLTEIMQSTFTNIPTLFLIYFLCKVYALSLLYMHKNIYTYIPILPSFLSPSPTTLT